MLQNVRRKRKVHHPRKKKWLDVKKIEGVRKSKHMYMYIGKRHGRVVARAGERARRKKQTTTANVTTQREKKKKKNKKKKKKRQKNFELGEVRLDTQTFIPPPNQLSPSGPDITIEFLRLPALLPDPESCSRITIGKLEFCLLKGLSPPFLEEEWD